LQALLEGGRVEAKNRTKIADDCGHERILEQKRQTAIMAAAWCEVEMGLLDFLFGKKGAKAYRTVNKTVKAAAPKPSKSPKSGIVLSAEISSASASDRNFVTYQNPIAREEGWVRLGATSEVSGIQFRKETAKAVLTALKRNEGVHVDLFREPKNEFDENAVMVFVSTKLLSPSLLGYIPRDQALELSRFSQEMPISGELSSMRSDGEYFYAKLVVLIPPSAKRRSAGWETKA